MYVVVKNRFYISFRPQEKCFVPTPFIGLFSRDLLVARTDMLRIVRSPGVLDGAFAGTGRPLRVANGVEHVEQQSRYQSPRALRIKSAD